MKPEPRRRGFAIVFWLLLLPVLYVASCGPVFWFYFRPPRTSPFETFVAVYRSILLVAGSNEVLRDWTQWYLRAGASKGVSRGIGEMDVVYQP